MAQSQHETVDLTGDDSDATLSATSDDGDLHRAIAMSLQSVPTSPQRGSSACSAKRVNSDTPEAGTGSVATVGGMLGIDRKKQEEERLARLKRKRTNSVSLPAIVRNARPARHLDDTRRQETTGAEAKTDAVVKKEGRCTSRSSLATRLQYPEGVVKKTWAFGFERANDIKLEEVLQLSQLETAVLSSFQVNWEWLLPKLDKKRIELMFVLQEGDSFVKPPDWSNPNVRLLYPSMKGQIWCMHSKLMLLFYPTYLRIVVPTANLTPYDWGEPFHAMPGGLMENTVFLADLPKRDLASDEDPNADVLFLQSMLYFLKAMAMPVDMRERLSLFDFSKLANHGFVHSIGGSHYGDAWRKTGACGLGRCLNELGLRTFDSLQIDIVTSSLGSLDDKFLRSLYLVAQGDSGLAEFTFRTAKAMPPSVRQDLERRLGKDFSSVWRQNLRFYYPSDDTVRASRGGPQNAGTICFAPRWWNEAKFPRDLMQDCQSQRAGLLMHNKVSQTICHAICD
jgi:Tyrosyl-DNA phosphodiesterase